MYVVPYHILTKCPLIPINNQATLLEEADIFSSALLKALMKSDTVKNMLMHSTSIKYNYMYLEEL